MARDEVVGPFVPKPLSLVSGRAGYELGPGFSFPAFAHTRSETHSAWQIQGSTVHLQFTVPDLESKRLTPDGDMPSVEQLGSYVADHVGALSGDQACKRSEGPRPVASHIRRRR